MASIWTGALSFGLVNIPVRLASAVRSAEQTSFRMLHEEDMTPIKYERVCPVDGEVVPWKEIVKGYEYAKGKYVVVTPEAVSSDAKTGLAWVPDLQPLAAWDNAERAWRDGP